MAQTTNHPELQKLESRLWGAADDLRANSKLKASEYSVPVLGLIFLRYADIRFAERQKDLEGKGGGRRTIGLDDYQSAASSIPPLRHEVSLSGTENPRLSSKGSQRF